MKQTNKKIGNCLFVFQDELGKLWVYLPLRTPEQKALLFPDPACSFSDVNKLDGPAH